MYRNIVILILTLLFLFTIALAGVIIELNCDVCGFKSDHLFAGGGMAGVSHTIIYCETCKNFYTVPTSKVNFETKAVTDINKPIGKKEFMGKERLVYSCPRCGSQAVAYDGPMCPICKKGTLRTEEKGLWD